MSVQDREVREGRIGPFMTFVDHVRLDGVTARWGSRRHRKHRQDVPAAGSTWWAPRARRPRSWSWWITLVNLIGSVAFGVSAVAGYINPATGQIHNAERSNLGTLVGAVCFFVGALLLLPERTEDGHSTAP